MAEDLREFDEQLADQQRKSEPDDEKRQTDLLAMPEKRAARKVRRWWDDQNELMRNRMAEWRANRARRSGISNVQVVKDRDRKSVTVWVPPGPQAPTMNKADRLCRRLAAWMFADPPLADATPARDDDEAREAAEFSTRVLADLDSEGNLDNPTTARQAFDLGSTYDSGFVRYYIDPTGGGKRPVRIKANAAVGTMDAALVSPGSPPYVERYVLEDGTLTDQVSPQIRQQWLPKLKAEVLSGKHIRFLPKTARDIWCAEGVLIGTLTPLGQLKDQFESLGKMSPEQLQALCSERPESYRELLPKGHEKYDRQADSKSDTPSDDALVFTITCYYLAGPRMPRGAYLVMGGEDILIYRGPWYDEQHDEPLDIALTQYKQFEDEDDPYGKGLMRVLGDGNEIRSAQIGALLEHLDRFTNRRTFYPITSTLQPKSLQATTATALPINPGGKPEYEEIPPFPTASQQMLEWISADMDDESGLQQTAQGVAIPSVESGLHAQQIIEQVTVGLSDLRQNTVRGLIRGWRIELQQIRAFYSVPQQISWLGEDGAYKQRMWTGADLAGTKDVRLQRGSFTSMTPSAKAAVAEHLHQLMIVDVHELERIALAQVGGKIGMQDNPHRMRVRRQIGAWQDGPPPGWMPPRPDPLTGAMQPDPMLAAIFRPLPADELPDVAIVRMVELGRAMAGTRAQRKPPEWQAGLHMEFERARQAAGIQTAAEQAQMAQQQQQMMQQESQADRDAKLKEAELKTTAGTQQAKITSEGEVREAEIMARAQMAPDINISLGPGQSPTPRLERLK